QPGPDRVDHRVGTALLGAPAGTEAVDEGSHGGGLDGELAERDHLSNLDVVERRRHAVLLGIRLDLQMIRTGRGESRHLRAPRAGPYRRGDDRWSGPEHDARPGEADGARASGRAGVRARLR